MSVSVPKDTLYPDYDEHHYRIPVVGVNHGKTLS
jgi:hypothetical protein